MSTYNPESLADRQLLAKMLDNLCLTSNFLLTEKPGCAEKVYAFEFKQVPGVSIYVYSTIVGDQVRALGADAIRVTVVYKRKDGKEMQLFKAARVFRTGQIEDIAERTQSQMRNAFKVFRHRTRSGFVCHCGTPKFDTKAGSSACAETCWLNHN